MTEKVKTDFEKTIDCPLHFHSDEKKMWEHQDRQLFDMMLRGDKISIEGINMLQTKRDERRLKQYQSLPVSNQESVVGTIDVHDSADENISASSDSDYNAIQEPSKKKRKSFRRGIDFKPVLLQAVRYGTSDQGVQDLCRSFCEVHDLDETFWLTKSTLNRHQIKMREEVLKRHKDQVHALTQTTNASINLHFDGFSNSEGCLAKWSLPDESSTCETPLAVQEYRDSPDGLTVYDFLSKVIRDFNLTDKLVTIGADTTALNSGTAGKGCLFRLDNSDLGKDLNIYYGQIPYI